jgi:hypothetical protein
MDLQKMIDELVNARVEAAVKAAFGEMAAEVELDRQVKEVNSKRNGKGQIAELRAAYTRVENGSDETPTRGRKRGRGRSAVGYIVKAYRGRGRRPMPDLVPTWKRAFEAIKAARGPVTAREIEAVTKDKQKTVESSIYQLRSLGLVQSVKLGSDAR